MNTPDLKPDLGLHRLKQGYGRSVAQCFYGIEVADIDFISPGLHSVMFEFREASTTYAASFDFDATVATAIFAKLSPVEQRQFLASIHGRALPFRATLPRPVMLESIECYLGELQHGVHDSFVPFIIRSIQ